MILAALLLGAYLLGSVPFAVLIGKFKGVDILATGSGNPGMTNVMRALGKGWGALCFVLDVAKSAVPATLARFLITEPVGPMDPQLAWFLVGLAAILGHCFSPFLRFRGGKGVSTALGAVLGAAPLVALACFGLFLVLLVTIRYMSVASLIGVGSSVVFGAFLPGQSPQILPVYAALALLVAVRHRKNLERLRAGTEPRFRLGKAG